MRERTSLQSSLIGLACTALVWGAVVGPAAAGNDEGILIGSQALMTGGAVTATVSDGTAAWYNPAGLATLQRATINVDGSTYGISYVTSENFITLPDGTQGSASVIDWQLIPTALSYARRLSDKVVGAFGVFVPHYTDSDLRTALTQGNGQRWTFGLDQYRAEYAYILSISVRTSDNFRWGVALHGIFISNEQMIQLGIGTPGSSTAMFGTYSSHTVLDDYGLRLGLGFQWTPLPRLALGMSLQSPTLTGLRSVTQDNVIGGFEAAEPAYDSTHEDSLTWVWELSTPLLVRMGAAYSFERVQLLLDGSVTTSVNSGEDALDRRFSGNARLGVLFPASDKITLGTGVFSDLNNKREYGDDFLGAVFGMKYAENYHLRENGVPLTFTTTVGVRYAYGWGKTQGIALSASDVTVADFSLSSVSQRIHEAAINLGAGVSY